MKKSSLSGLQQDWKVLMIGNSFSICVGKYLPSIVHAAPGCHLHLTSAYIGGCSLEMHWNNILAAAEDPAADPYRITQWDSDDPETPIQYRHNVAWLLQNHRYDIITIQQASHFSWDPATYQPYAENLIGFIHQHNPDAEILIQQTWAYRADDPRFGAGENTWGFGQTEMAKRAADAYRKLAEQYRFRVIPTGDAVQIARARDTVTYLPPAASALAALRYPDLPQQSGDVVGRDFWKKDPESGEMTLAADRIHLNERGEYLQACVWFGILFGRSPEKIGYDAPSFGGSYCRFLRECAQSAVASCQQIQG